MRVEVFSSVVQTKDFEPLEMFITFLHRLRVIKRISFNPGSFVADAAAYQLTPVPRDYYVRLVYEKWHAK